MAQLFGNFSVTSIQIARFRKIQLFWRNHGGDKTNLINSTKRSNNATAYIYVMDERTRTGWIESPCWQSGKLKHSHKLCGLSKMCAKIQ